MSSHLSRAQPLNSTSSLCVEELESRVMLSTVQIFASGETGQEQFALRVDGQVVATYNAGQQISTFEYESTQSLAPEQIQIEFLNDAYDPAQNLDRNLRVDSIGIDGQLFESEDSSVYSTGTYLPGDGVTAGFGRGEVLHTNGYFQYGPVDSRTVIEIRARGDEGTEVFNVFINGGFARTLEATQDFQTFTLYRDADVTPDDVLIQFTNDQYDPSIGLDANLVVDHIRIDGTTYQTEDPSVYSTGTWRPSDGIVPGFGRGEYLNVGGYFRYGSPATGSTIEIEARGSEGGEQFHLIIDGQIVETFTTTNFNQEFSYQASGSFSERDVQIEFFNDLFDPANSIDRNLNVNFIRVDGEVFETGSATVFSTGTWTATDGIVDGFGRGEVLNSNGIFDFGALQENTRYRVTFDATWSNATHPGGFPPGAHFSGLIGATHNEFVQFWGPGGPASRGIEDVAELGSKTNFTSEINSVIANGGAGNVISGGGITLSPDSVSLEFDASTDHFLVSLISMLAPSPDWFVGVRDLLLIDDNGWIDETVIQLNAYDAGTDNGLNFNSADVDNSGGIITRITSGPLANNGSVAPLGTFRFERIG